MQVLKLMVVGVSLAGCAHVESAAPAPPACGSGFAPLRFAEGKASLEPGFAHALLWSSRMASDCQVSSVRIVGLPPPSDGTLAGQRSATVAAVLQGFGLPTPTFEFGGPEAQASPQLAIDAIPR